MKCPECINTNGMYVSLFVSEPCRTCGGTQIIEDRSSLKDEERIEYSDGSKYWFLNGKFHRADGPAIEYRNGFGNKFWYLNGKLHRADGPACEYASGNKSWWLHGKEYSEEEYEYFTRQKHI